MSSLTGLAAVIAEATQVAGDSIAVADHRAALTRVSEAAAAEIETARAAARAEGAAAGAGAERARISRILSHAEAAKRPALARNLALETDMSADQAAKILAATPAEAAAGALMAMVPQPAVEAGHAPAPKGGLAAAVDAQIESMKRS